MTWINDETSNLIVLVKQLWASGTGTERTGIENTVTNQASTRDAIWADCSFGMLHIKGQTHIDSNVDMHSFF
jgi:hypothetical protein